MPGTESQDATHIQITCAVPLSYVRHQPRSICSRGCVLQTPRRTWGRYTFRACHPVLAIICK